MADKVLRTAGLRLTIDGAAEFTSSLGKTNANIKLSNTEISKLSAAYNLNSDKIPILTAKQETLKTAISNQKDKTQELNKVLEATKEKYGENSTEAIRLQAEINNSEKATMNYEKQLNDLNKTVEEQTNRSKKMAEALEKSGEKIKQTGTVMQNAGKSMTAYVTAPIVGIGVAAYKSSVDFESAFAGVKKTVDATEDELAGFRKEILNMSMDIPASANAIAGVAEAAGQLGIHNDSLMSFTKVMIDLGNSTNLSADEAATTLAKFANIVSMNQGDFDRLGSTIVHLGNKFATTEADIAAMSLRLAGAGHQVGLSEAEIMGFATALSSVGIEAEAGGSAFSKVMIQLQLAVETQSESLKDWAAVAGMSAEEFTVAFRDNAAGAINTFVKGLGDTEQNGATAIKVLNDLGVEEIRMRDALLRASGASDVFTNAINAGTTAWDENNALTKEASQRYETTASKNQIFLNKLTNLGIQLGEVIVPAMSDLVDMLSGAVEWFSKLDPSVQSTIIKFAGFAAATGPVLSITGKLTSGIGSLVGGFGKLVGWAAKASGSSNTIVTSLAKLAPAAATAASGIGGVGTAAASATAATGGALSSIGASLGAIGTAVAPALPIIASVGVAVGAVVAAHHVLTKEVIPEVDLFKDKWVTTYDELGNITSSTVTKISDETKTAVQSYMDMSTETQAQITSLYTGQIAINDENIPKVIEQVKTMTEKVTSSYEEQKNSVIEGTKEAFTELGIINSEEYAAAISSLETHYDDKKTKAESAQNEMIQILKASQDQEHGMTVEQKSRIDALNSQMADFAIESMAKDMNESIAILENKKNSNTRITADMVSAEIQKINELKETTVALAQEKRDKQIAIAENLREVGTDEALAAAESITNAANLQYDGVVKAADKTRVEGIDKLYKAYGDLEGEVEFNTGEILTWWDKMFGTWERWDPKKKYLEVEAKLDKSQFMTSLKSLSYSLKQETNEILKNNSRSMNKSRMASLPNMKKGMQLNYDMNSMLSKRIQKDVTVISSVAENSEDSLKGLSKELEKAFRKAIVDYSPKLVINDREWGQIINKTMVEVVR